MKKRIDLLKLISDDIEWSGIFNPLDYFPVNTLGYAFLCFCMGINNLRLNRIDDAKKHFGNAKKNTLCKYMLRYLVNSEYANDIGTMKIWSKTNLAQLEYNFICSTIKTTLKKRNIVPDLFLDIGIGDGQLTKKVYDIIFELNQNAKLMINDKSPEMLDVALRNIRYRYSQNTHIEQLYGKIQDITLQIDKTCEIILVNAASVFHELKRSEKKSVLEMLKHISDCVFISDLEGSHDIVDNNSRKLIASVFEFYDGLIHDTICCSNLPIDMGEKVTLSYLIPEACDILLNDYDRRVNYHTTMDDWIYLFEQTGWKYCLFQQKFDSYLPCFFTFNIFR